jgi:membrane peptidoglycan carboxypeptidase
MRQAKDKPASRFKKRFNPIQLRKTPPRQPNKSAAEVVEAPVHGLVWWKRLPKHLALRKQKLELPGKTGKNGKKKFRFFSWKTLLIGLGALLLISVVTIVSVFLYYVRDLPNPRELSKQQIAESTRILDRNGQLLHTFYGDENRIMVKTEDMSAYIRQATVAVEDANFYQHGGYDLRGITRAVVCRVFPACGGRVAGGGSTITQQYVKNAVLHDNSYSIDRKLQELILSIELEQVYSKDEILTGYLNEVSYGGSVRGIGAAAEVYFGKSVKDLSLAEAATLAAIPQRPTYFWPYGQNQKSLFARKDFILDRMAEAGYITTEEATTAKAAAPNNESVSFRPRGDMNAPHFVFYVRQQLLAYLQELNPDADAQQLEAGLDAAGYTVTTSLDSATQSMAQGVVTEMAPGLIEKYGASNAALVAVEPTTGEVLAMVGSIDYTTSTSGNTNFANALLQPGSSFKPLVYATSFNEANKKSPATTLFDLETDFGNGYIPKNYDNRPRGPVTVRNALAQSLNISAVKAAGIVGVSGVIDTAKALGITSFTRPVGEYGLAIALGGGETRPVEMAGAYATFANGGKHNTVRPILTIEKNGKIIKDFREDVATQAISPEVAWQISSILSDNQARTPVFGSRNNFTLADRPVAAKSGTTNSNRDAWTIGYTPQLSVAVWIGNNLPNQTMKRGADGSVVAAPIWKKFMTEYHTGKPVQEFSRPSTMQQVTVEQFSGKLVTDQTPGDRKVTDWFAPWQVPTESENTYTTAVVDSVSGKLATELTPLANRETRTFAYVRSEFPDRPNWEDPVRSWASANGLNVSAPTEYDDLHTDNNLPTLRIISPTDGSEVSGVVSVIAQPGGARAITSVTATVNGSAAGSATAAPWRIDIAAATFSPGTNFIDVTVTNDLNLTRTVRVTVGVGGGDTTPPGAVSNTTIQALPGRVARIAWTNPSDSDLSGVHIYQSLAPGILGSRVLSVPATAGSIGTTQIGSLPSGTVYFTLRAYDSQGNEQLNSNQVSVTTLP